MELGPVVLEGSQVRLEPLDRRHADDLAVAAADPLIWRWLPVQVNSREDLELASLVGTFWLVANAVQRDPTLREAMAEFDNVRVAEAAHGDGVYEAVVTSLAEARDAPA